LQEVGVCFLFFIPFGKLRDHGLHSFNYRFNLCHLRNPWPSVILTKNREP
jgi:hypothetical protein